MKKIVTPNGTFGPYREVEDAGDRYVVDGAHLQKGVVDPDGLGCTVEDWTGPLPGEPDPAERLAQAKAEARAKLASDRWDATQFFTYDGVRTQADKAVSVITGRLALRDETGLPTTQKMGFKLGDNEFRQWDRAEDVAFGAAVGQHIQACFDLEAAALVDIEAAVTPHEALAVPASVEWPS